MHHSERGWIGYTYRWNDQETDAEWVQNPINAQYEGPSGTQTCRFEFRLALHIEH